MSANILQLREVKVAGIRFRDVGDAANALEVTVNVYFIDIKDHLTLSVYMSRIPNETDFEQTTRSLEKAYDLLAFVPDKKLFQQLARQ